MKKLFMSCLLILTACSLTDNKDEGKTPETPSVKDFKSLIAGSWDIVPARGSGSFSVPLSSAKLDFTYLDTSSKDVSMAAAYYAEIETNAAVYKMVNDGYYFGIIITNSGQALYIEERAYSSLSNVFGGSLLLYAVRSSNSSGGGGGSGGGSGGDDTQDRVPSPYEEDFLRNLKLPYAYRNGTYYFKIEDNGDFVFHDINKGTPYRFYTAKSATSALYRNASKTQYYLFELDASGNLKRSAASGTQNTGSTTIFAFRDDTQFDIIFTDTLRGRYNSPIGETGYKENRIFTADTTGSFRIANDPYQLIRVISKNQAVYKRFNLYYGLSLSNSKIWLFDQAIGASSANEIGGAYNYNDVEFASPYSGGEADTPNLLTGATDREKYLQNVSGKKFSGINGYQMGYFMIDSSGNFMYQQYLSGFGKAERYSLSKINSPIDVQYGSTNFIIDPFGGLRVSTNPVVTFSYTPRDYETEYRNGAPGTGDKSELIVAGQSYYLVRIITPRAAIYLKLGDKYYGILNYNNVRTKGFNSPDEVNG